MFGNSVAGIMNSADHIVPICIGTCWVPHEETGCATSQPCVEPFAKCRWNAVCRAHSHSGQQQGHNLVTANLAWAQNSDLAAPAADIRHVGEHGAWSTSNHRPHMRDDWRDAPKTYPRFEYSVHRTSHLTDHSHIDERLEVIPERLRHRTAIDEHSGFHVLFQRVPR